MLAAARGTACELASDLTSMSRVRQLRDQFWTQLKDRFRDKVVLNGHPDRRLPNTLNVSFVARVGGDVLAALPGIAASTGSACHSGHVELSAVLAAMRVPPIIGMGAVRFSLGRATQSEEIFEVIERLARVIS